MPRRRHCPEAIVTELRRVEVVIVQGRALGEALRALGVAEATHRRWRNEHGGLKLAQVRRLRELELESSRLRRAVSGLPLDKQVLAEAFREDRPALRGAGARSSRSAPSLAGPSAEPARSLASRARPGVRCWGSQTMRSGSQPPSSSWRPWTGATATAASRLSCVRQAGS
jgi:putative transposase